jgi:competence protein ComEC
MRTLILSFVAGVACLQCQATLPTWPAFWIGLAALAGCLLVRRGRWRSVLLIAGGVLLGFGWAALLAHSALADQLAPADEGRDIKLVGTIDNLPYHFDGGVRFNFAVERVIGDSMIVPPRISLSWYSGFREKVVAIGDVQPGERWQLRARLQRPHGNANPYGFDYEVWLLEQGVRATGYVRPAGVDNRRLDSFVFSVGNVVEHCRALLRARILRALPDKPYAGVIVALVVGDQRGIDLGGDI